MLPSDLRRLIKIEERIGQLATEKYGLKVRPIEFDVIPPQKMLEIMAYKIPTNISNWKFGRDYERIRTIHDNLDPGLPYEVVINSDPPRAYIMNTNTFAVQALVIAHVYGHEDFFSRNKWFSEGRRDIMSFMHELNQRLLKYERRYGIDIVEMTVDAGHALQLHSSPFDNETENQKRERIFEQMKLKARPIDSEFNDIVKGKTQEDENMDVGLRNQKIWRKLMLKTPVEPTEDMLRYIIDNSRVLEDWQRDILEGMREEGRYFWPMMKTRFMNEGWATYWHEFIMNDLFEEGLLNQLEHGQYIHSNSLVKAMQKGAMNPYLIGSEIWRDLKERWDKGRHGYEYDNCPDSKEKENWDTKDMKGNDKLFEVCESYTDWFFMQDFLTAELVDKIDLYVFKFVETMRTVDVVRTKHTANQIRELIIRSFSHSLIPKIEVKNGNFKNTGAIKLIHRHTGVDLDFKYAVETMKHIFNIYGAPVILETILNGEKILFQVTQKGLVSPKKPKKARKKRPSPWSTVLSPLDFPAQQVLLQE